MIIATPISTLFVQSDEAQNIVDASDVLECRDHSVHSVLPHQELFHFEAELIHPWSAEQRSFIQTALEAKPELKVISFHSASCCSHPVVDGGVYQPGGTMFTREELLQHAAENTEWLRSILSHPLTIAIENNNAYATSAYQFVADGDFLSELTQKQNLSFLFDVAHAHITAFYKGIPYEEYRSSLPLSRIIQVHICQWGIRENGEYFDAHNAPNEATFGEVRQLLQDYPSLQYGTVEYYRDTENLLSAIHTLRSL